MWQHNTHRLLNGGTWKQKHESETLIITPHHKKSWYTHVHRPKQTSRLHRPHKRFPACSAPTSSLSSSISLALSCCSVVSLKPTSTSGSMLSSRGGAGGGVWGGDMSGGGGSTVGGWGIVSSVWRAKWPLVILSPMPAHGRIGKNCIWSSSNAMDDLYMPREDSTEQDSLSAVIPAWLLCITGKGKFSYSRVSCFSDSSKCTSYIIA